MKVSSQRKGSIANVLVAAILAVVAGAIVYFAVQPAELEIIPDKKANRVFEKRGERPEPSASGPHPKLVCPNELHKFGLMELGTERSNVYKIRNEGEADLIMKTGTPTCKCTHFQLSKSKLKPGEECEVFLTWKPKAESHEFRQRAPIHTNDPANEIFWLALEGVVAQAIDTEPTDQWSTGTISADVPTEVRGTVFSRMLDAFELVDLQSDCEGISLNYQPMDSESLKEIPGAKSGYEIVASISPDLPLGKFEEQIQFKMKSDQEVANKDEVYSVTLSGHKLGPVQFIPLAGVRFNSDNNRLSIGEFSASDGRKAKMLVFVSQHPDGEEIKIEGVESSLPFVKAEMVQVKSPPNAKKRFELRIEVPPGSPAGNREAKNAVDVVIKTNHPQARSIPLKLGFFSI